MDVYGSIIYNRPDQYLWCEWVCHPVQSRCPWIPHHSPGSRLRTGEHKLARFQSDVNHYKISYSH